MEKWNLVVEFDGKEWWGWGLNRVQEKRRSNRNWIKIEDIKVISYVLIMGNLCATKDKRCNDF